MKYIIAQNNNLSFLSNVKIYSKINILLKLVYFIKRISTRMRQKAPQIFAEL